MNHIFVYTWEVQFLWNSSGKNKRHQSQAICGRLKRSLQ